MAATDDLTEEQLQAIVDTDLVQALSNARGFIEAVVPRSPAHESARDDARNSIITLLPLIAAAWADAQEAANAILNPEEG